MLKYIDINRYRVADCGVCRRALLAAFVAFCRARAAPYDLARRLPLLLTNAQGLNADVE